MTTLTANSMSQATKYFLFFFFLSPKAKKSNDRTHEMMLAILTMAYGISGIASQFEVNNMNNNTPKFQFVT
jgi:hypothetical protein